MSQCVFKLMTTALIVKKEIKNVSYMYRYYIWIYCLFQKKVNHNTKPYIKTTKYLGIFNFFTALAYNKRFDVSEYGMADLDDLLSELPATSIVVSSRSRFSLANKAASLINNIFMQF